MYPPDTYPKDTYPPDTYPLDTYPLDTYPLGHIPPVTYPLDTYPLDIYPPGHIPPRTHTPHTLKSIYFAYEVAIKLTDICSVRKGLDSQEGGGGTVPMSDVNFDKFSSCLSCQVLNKNSLTEPVVFFIDNYIHYVLSCQFCFVFSS